MKGRVSPFGNPRIKGCSPLLAAYRSVLRPSSPLSAKAFTRCPYLALDPKPTRRAQRQGPEDQATGRNTIASATQHFSAKLAASIREQQQDAPDLHDPKPSSCRAERPAHDQPHHLSTMFNSGRRTLIVPRHLRSFGLSPSGIGDRSHAGSDARSLLRPGPLVEPTGFEPVTPCLQSRCSPS
jgi:hypothetical protein